MQPALDTAVSYTGTPWLPARGTVESCDHTVATAYSQLATLCHLPSTRSFYLQVRLSCAGPRICGCIQYLYSHLRWRHSGATLGAYSAVASYGGYTSLFNTFTLCIALWRTNCMRKQDGSCRPCHRRGVPRLHASACLRGRSQCCANSLELHNYGLRCKCKLGIRAASHMVSASLLLEVKCSQPLSTPRTAHDAQHMTRRCATCGGTRGCACRCGLPPARLRRSSRSGALWPLCPQPVQQLLPSFATLQRLSLIHISEPTRPY